MPENRKPRFAGKKPSGANRSTPPKTRVSAEKPASDATVDEPEPRERIAKRIARSGLASRRDAEAMIAEGRVKVNGNVLTSPAFTVTAKDMVVVDGEKLPDRERTRLFLFHKPSGTMTTNRDPEGRKTIFDVLPKGLPRLMTVGRLDFTTEGLLLMTNDGGLARVLELPSTGWLRRYRVRVHGTVVQQALEGLKEGIAVDGVLYGAIDAELERQQGSNAWLQLSLREGKNREIKNVLGALGLDVTRLIRISYGPFQLGSLDPGAIMELKGRTLKDQLGERLIREARADFDSDILTPFSNRPEKKDHRQKEKSNNRGGQDRSMTREEALGRLQTEKPSRHKPRDKARSQRDDKEDAPQKKRGFEPPRSRASNVWMAPGAKPKGNRKKHSGSGEGPAGKTGAGGHGKPAGRHADAKHAPSGKKAKHADRRR